MAPWAEWFPGAEGEEETACRVRRREQMMLGGALRRAWIGYQQLLEREMAETGFERRGFPDGRVLHLCARRSDVTISQIGRELGITRQGASKIVGVLREGGFVTVHPSPVDHREKVVAPTAYGRRYLEAQHKAAQTIEGRLRVEVGSAAFEGLYKVLDVLGGDETPRLRTYLRARSTGPYLD